MKTKLTALLLAAAAVLALVPKQAQAGDKELALIGGFIGGLIVGAALDDRHDARYETRYDTVVVSHDYDRDYDRGYHRHDRPRGYWDYRTVRVWVPGYWETSYDCGRRVRVFVPGYYETRRERVWVAHNRRGPRHW
jgi:hypothetical protein